MSPVTPEQRREIAQELLGKAGSFSAYFRLYDDLDQRDHDFVFAFDEGTFCTPKTYQDVLLAAQKLRENVDITKEELAALLQKTWKTSAKVENVINMAVQAMIMVDSAARDWHPADFTLGGYRPVSWLPQESFLTFLERSFPMNPNSSFAKVQRAIEERAALKAWKLQKRLGLCLRPTENIAEHLLLVPKTNTLLVFHHAAYLKAQLERFQDDPEPLEIGTKESLIRGSLPPQLLVETLHSLQGIIFPSIDSDSSEILDELVGKSGFDPECAQYEGYKIFPEPPEGLKYVYWGERIAHLHDLLLSRPPRNKVERWFQQWSTERNAFSIAILALLITIVVGIVGIGLTSFQIWITWMAWKYPVNCPK
ncbi:Fc.00g008590.m01.CDS01 [Cosmosporella sp. VM-42]